MDQPSQLPSKEALGEALAERLRPCPFCGGTSWQTDRTAAGLPTFEEQADGSLKVIGKGDDDGLDLSFVTVLPVVCRDCGYIALFHLRALQGQGPQTDD